MTFFLFGLISVLIGFFAPMPIVLMYIVGINLAYAIVYSKQGILVSLYLIVAIIAIFLTTLIPQIVSWLFHYVETSQHKVILLLASLCGILVCSIGLKRIEEKSN